MNDGAIVHGGLDMTFAELTGIGGRTSNQDRLRSARRHDAACFVVSDGAGGHEGGEIASAVVVDTVIAAFLEAPSLGSSALRYCIDCAAAAIARRKAEQERLTDMSATVATILIDLRQRHALWAHLGDSRIYHFRDGEVLSMTKDHSVIQQFIDAGYCAQEQLRSHPQRSTLFAAVGAEGNTHPEISKEPHRLRDGDAFLVCTDGFCEWIVEEEMERMLAAAGTVDEWLHAMGAAVDKNGRAASGARDNFSAFAVWLNGHRTGKPETQSTT